MLRAYLLVPNMSFIPNGVRTQQGGRCECRWWSGSVSVCRSALADYSTSEMLVNMGNLPLDEFYPAVSMVALMRIFRDQSLSHHHTMVVQAITFIFKSLGLKCVQFLPQVMPTFLNVIRVCDGAIREVSSWNPNPCSSLLQAASSWKVRVHLSFLIMHSAGRWTRCLSSP